MATTGKGLLRLVIRAWDVPQNRQIFSPQGFITADAVMRDLFIWEVIPSEDDQIGRRKRSQTAAGTLACALGIRLYLCGKVTDAATAAMGLRGRREEQSSVRLSKLRRVYLRSKNRATRPSSTLLREPTLALPDYLPRHCIGAASEHEPISRPVSAQFSGRNAQAFRRLSPYLRYLRQCAALLVVPLVNLSWAAPCMPNERHSPYIITGLILRKRLREKGALSTYCPALSQDAISSLAHLGQWRPGRLQRPKARRSGEVRPGGLQWKADTAFPDARTPNSGPTMDGAAML